MTVTASSEADKRKIGTAGVFSRAASTYDQVGPRFFAHYGRRLVELAQVSQGSEVLDIACGRGASLFPAAEQIGLGGRAVGIDLAEGMVEALTPEIRVRGLDNVEARVMDAENLLFPDATFDYVLCGFSLFFFPNLERALSEMVRVLKPKGRLVSSTWGKADERWRWLDNLLESYLPEPPRPSEQPQTPVPDFETPDGMEAIMRGAGFGGVKIVGESRDFTYASEEEWWSTLWSHGMRFPLERIESTLGNEGLAKFKAQAFETIQGLKTPDGIRQTFPVLYTLATKS
jgi:ubiquinone/menaquinone biosynthesis C-methylase UbiE